MEADLRKHNKDVEKEDRQKGKLINNAFNGLLLDDVKNMHE